MTKYLSQGREELYDGKAKTMFAGDEAGTLIQYFKDDATAFNALKHDIIDGKGNLNNIISAHIMEHLADKNIKTHFIKRLNDREQLIKKVEIIPVEVIVRNYAAGTLVKRYGVEDKMKLPCPLVEFCYKSDEHGDPLISREHAIIFGWASDAELKILASEALKINEILTELFAKIGITLADFKLEFGRIDPAQADGASVILADEISPDCCRLWDTETATIMDKDRFRKDLGELTKYYAEVATRLGIDLS